MELKVPGYIRHKMHLVAQRSKQNENDMRDVEEWLEARGFDTSMDGLRDGSGCSLDELEYGIDITDELCERIERGDCRTGIK